MKDIRDNNYILIQGWMINSLHLKGNELIIFAIIYGFSQISQQKFTGSLQYLADWTGASKRGVLNSLQNLAEKGYIEKTEKFVSDVKFCEYNASENIIKAIQMPESNCTNSNANIQSDNPCIPRISKKADDFFDMFWKAYPRKVGKKAAIAAWSKIVVTEERLQIFLTAIENQKKSAEWKKDNGQFIPYPATWLNGERWDDILTLTEQETHYLN